jgi:hypothetical protein
MSGDFKWDVQCIFEDLVFARYGHTDYSKLPNDEQYRLYNAATREYSERLANRADMLRDIEKERPR